MGATWETAGVAAAGAGKGVVGVVLSGPPSTVAAVVGGANVGGLASEEEGEGAGAVEAGGGAGVAIGAAAGVSTAASSAAAPGAAKALEGSPTGSAAGCFSGCGGGGGVGSTGCGRALISSEGAARRLPKDTGKAEAGELGWGAEKVGLGFCSGGLNKLPKDAPLDKSEPAGTSGAAWRIGPKLNGAAPAAAAFDGASFASSPCPTRSPEKLPRVSPPPAFAGCGSTLKAAAEDGGLSAEATEGTVEEALLAAAETLSPGGWPKTILPFPKENWFISLPARTQRTKKKKEIQPNEEVCRGYTSHNTALSFTL